MSAEVWNPTPDELVDLMAPRLAATPDRAPLPYRTAREIASATPERPAWLAVGYAARQAITELDGKIKSAGKTTFVTHLVAAVLDGLPFLSSPTEQTRVVYFTEQSPGSFREALRRAGLLDRGDELRVIFRRDVTALPWPELVARVTADALRDGYGLLVVDTLGKLAGIREENDAGAAAEAMAPLQDAAHDGLAVIVCRHERKGGGEVGEAARGSSAFGGDVDIILSLRRPEGNQRHTLRELHGLSRYDETPERVVLDLTLEGYELLGDVESVAIAEAVRIVSFHLGEWFETNQSGPTVAELAEATELPPSTIRRALRDMQRAGRAESTGKGVRGDPQRWRLQGSTWATPEGSGIDSDQTPSPKGTNESNGSAGVWP